MDHVLGETVCPHILFGLIMFADIISLGACARPNAPTALPLIKIGQRSEDHGNIQELALVALRDVADAEGTGKFLFHFDLGRKAIGYGGGNGEIRGEKWRF